MGTDWDGCIYVMDPQTSQSSYLKRFDRKGRFREAWGPIDAHLGKAAAVTKDGYIWTGLSRLDPEDYTGLPVVVYRKGQKAPVLDWRHKLPKELDDAIRKALKEKGMEWKKGKGWMVFGLESGPREVALRLGGEIVGHDNWIARDLWILMRSDGRKTLDAKVTKDGYGEETPYLALDGRFWAIQSDIDVKRFIWSKVWLWEKGKKKGEPLVDRTMNKEPWAGKFTLGKAYVPTIKIDGKGHIYLMLGQLSSYTLRVVVEGKVLEDKLSASFSSEGERALIVLDRRKRLVSYLPWIPNSVEAKDMWVKPLPDGSGFYRIQFLEKEAQVFFHPLPR